MSISIPRVVLASLLAGLCALPARAAAADSLDLFSSHQPLSMRLRFDFGSVCRGGEELRCGPWPAELTIGDGAGRFAVQLETRGRWHERKGGCPMPALFVHFDPRELPGTLFEGRPTIPLTTHCNPRKQRLHQCLVREYLAYRIYNLLTQRSVSVRLAEITWVDTATGSEERFFGFFSEHFDRIADRLGQPRIELDHLDPTRTRVEDLAMLSVFQFMIGNLDWSAIEGHNIVTFEADDGTVTVVPFDFDYAGLVHAKYATAPEIYRMRDVRIRHYRGFCHPGLDWEAVYARFDAIRPEVDQLVAGMPVFDDASRKKARRYIDKFYRIIDDPNRREQQIEKRCRPYPGIPSG